MELILSPQRAIPDYSYHVLSMGLFNKNLICTILLDVAEFADYGISKFIHPTTVTLFLQHQQISTKMAASSLRQLVL